jgi:undecaprenyl-diphosphatase
MEFLKGLDTTLFLWINHFNSQTFDFIMYWLSNRFIWIPFYVYLIYWLFTQYGKPSWRIVCLALVLLVLTDQTSSALLKPLVQRLRPCHEPALAGLVHLVANHCGGEYGFVSSHAANTFGLAVLMGFCFRDSGKAWAAWGILGWAACISYSRVYLGVHYPADVLCGGLLGALLAYVLVALTRRWLPLRGHPIPQ